jgi:aldose 1-epimerase
VRTLTLLGALGVVAACSAPQTPAPAPPPRAPAISASSPAGVTAPLAAPAPAPARPAIERAAYGKADGKDVWLFTLANAHGLKATITNYGATLTTLEVPDRNGKLADIVLGFDDLAGYERGDAFFGAIVGRVANRIRNATFSLGGKTYHLAANDPPHALHGGPKNFSRVVWDAKPVDTAAGPSLELTYVSKDGEEGYPGTLTAKATYTLTDANELSIEMEATTDRTTLVNLAHHSYWNLAGHDAGRITDHELTLFADAYTPGDPMVPTGVVKSVRNTPFDFTVAKPIGRDLQQAGGTPVGFDHNFVVNGDPNALRPVARVRDPKSGRVLTLQANQPGVQFYTGNFLNGTLHGKGATYAQYTGFCLETQKFPNAVNVPAWRNQVILEPGQTYRHVMVHRFSVE